MPLYDMVCFDCGNTAERYAPIQLGKGSTNCECGSILRRDWHHAPYVLPTFQEHFNHTVGKRVSSMQDFKNALAEGSDRLTERTGVEHKFTPIDRDAAAEVGVTDTELVETKRVHRKQGLDQRKRSYF